MLFKRLLLVCFLLSTLSEYAAAATLKQCKRKWRLNNITTGMSFGTFSIEVPAVASTITLTGGGARTSTGSIDLVSGSAINSHQIEIDNTQSFDCGLYGITIDFSKVPDSMPMRGTGADIPISNTQVIISGEGLVTLPYTFYPPSVPLNMEITSTMTPTAGQMSGAYASRNYTITVEQDGGSRKKNGKSTTVAITPLALTAGVAMNFGQIASGSSGGTLIMDTSGARSVGSGDADVVNNGVAGTAGTFFIVGDASLTFSVTYTDGVLRNNLDASTMTISGFTDTSTGLVLTGGSDSFSVGATLTLNGLQSKGNYSTANPGGTPYSVTVNYN